MKRRELLVGGLGLLGAAELSREEGPEGTTSTAVFEVRGAERGLMVKEALAAVGGINTFVKPGQRVVLKPNLAFANPVSWATGSHPDVVAAVAAACVEAGASQVVVVESPVHSVDLLRKSECVKLLRRAPVSLEFLDRRDQFSSVTIPTGRVLKAAHIASAVLRADVVINLAQAKHDFSSGVSFGLKNGLGVVWESRHQRLWTHPELAVADIASVYRPALTILDATDVLAAHGPFGPGPVLRLGKMFIGRDVVAVDSRAMAVLPRLGPSRISESIPPRVA